MANNGVITIKFVDGNKKVPGPEPINDKMDKTEGSTSELETAVMAALIKRAADQIKGMVINEAKYQINMHYNLTDDYLGQQRLNIALNVVEKVASIGLSIYTGAKLGAKAGPWGAVAGGLIAGTLSIASLGQQINHNYEQERIRLNQMDANLSFNRQRAGYSLTAGSIGENR